MKCLLQNPGWPLSPWVLHDHRPLFSNQFNTVVDKVCRSALTIRPREWLLLERSWFFLLFLSSVLTTKTEEFCVPGTGSWMRHSNLTCGYSLFSTFPLLNFLAFFLSLLASAVLNTFFLCRDARDDIVKWVVDNANRLDFWWATVQFQSFTKRNQGRNSTHYIGRSFLSISKDIFVSVGTIE